MTDNITHNVTILSNNYYFKYGLYKMIARLDRNEVALNTRDENVSDANIVFRKTIVSINYAVNTEPPDAPSAAKELAVDIPFSCDSLSITEVQAKLEKILSLSHLNLSSANDKIIFQQMGVKNHQQLSNTENKVLRYFGMGYCPQDIAKKLGCSDKTVSTHCRNAMRKMGISKKSELYRFASCIMQHLDRERVTLCL